MSNPHTDIDRRRSRWRLTGQLNAFYALWIRARHCTALRWMLENT